MITLLLVGLAAAEDDEPPPEQEAELGSEIVVEARRPSPHAVRQVLDRERVERTPGAWEDPLRVVQALPGLAVIPEYSPASGDLVIRGAAPGESRFFVEGVELPYLYHFSQYASVIHTGVLDEIALYPSAFGPNYGNTAGGVVEARLKDPIDEPDGGQVRANMMMASAHGELHEGWSDASALSMRRSYLDVFESGSDQYTLWPVFWDYLGRHVHELDSGARLSITALGAGDSYGRYMGDTALLDPLEQEANPELQLNRRFHGVIAKGDAFLPRGRVETTVALVQDVWRAELAGDHQDRVDTYGIVRSQALLFHDGAHQLSLGTDIKVQRVDRDVHTSAPQVLLEDEAPLLARGVNVDDSLGRVIAGFFFEPRLNFGASTLQPGMRFQLQSHTPLDPILIDPRVTFQSELAPDLRLRAGGGLYSQVPELDDLDEVTGNPALLATRAAHIAAGLDSVIAKRLELNLDLWARSIDSAVAHDPGQIPVSVHGRAWGLELGSRYRIRDTFFTWLSLSLGRAERDGASFDYDQPFAIHSVVSWDFRPSWNAGLRYRYAAGLPHTPIVGGLYDGTVDAYLPIVGETNTARLPNYQKLDLHLERGWQADWGTIAVYGELWWVLGGNVLYPVYSYDHSELAHVAGPPFLPLAGVRIGT
jgi:hypothetical protein